MTTNHLQQITPLGDSDGSTCRSSTCLPTERTIEPPVPLHDIEFRTPEGLATALSAFAGNVVLVVNTASKCGLTPQYEGLQRLHTSLSARGFTVLGFPSNDFMGQEPGTDAEIAEFCSLHYSVSFPLMSKVRVAGEGKHPLFAELTRLVPEAEGNAAFRDSIRGNGAAPTEAPDVVWNFEKFLISRRGEVIARFSPGTAPEDPALVQAVESALQG